MSRLVLCLVVAIVASGACIPSTRSGDYECSKQTDCHDGRFCVEGYCVTDGKPPIDAPEGCPMQCNAGCDPSSMACNISCTNNGQCPQAMCPVGWDCTIQCKSNACDIVDCTNAHSCTIVCEGASGCDQIACGAGKCAVTCATNNSCGVVSCPSSCACDISCPGALCGQQSCPMDQGNPCTQDQSPTTNCSSGKPGCDTCT